MAWCKTIGTLLLRCQNNRSDKEYLIELSEESLDGITATRQLRSKYGKTGKLHISGILGDYTSTLLGKTVDSKLKKGYEIVQVNSRPFTSGIVSDAINIMTAQIAFNHTSTAQPAQRIRAIEVEVTFDEGQCAPVW